MNTAAKSKACSTRVNRTLAFALPLLLPFACFAQQNKLVVHPANPLTIKRGASATAELNVAVLPGFHVNGDKPKDEFLIPLKLTWNGGPLQVAGVEYPPPQEMKVGSQDLTVLTGSFVIRTKFTAPAGVPGGSSVLTGKLRYQACNNQMCFRPSSVDVQLPVQVQ